MRTSIRTRILLAMNLLVAAVALAVGYACIELASAAIERRIVDESVQQAAAFVGNMTLPRTDRMMTYLAQMYGSEMAIREGTTIHSSLSGDKLAELTRQISTDNPPQTIRIGTTDYRLGRATVPQEARPGTPPVTLYLLASEERIQAAQREAAKSIVYATLAAVAVVTVLGVWIAATISRPLRQLADRMDRLAGGNVPGSGPQGIDGSDRRNGSDGKYEQLAGDAVHNSQTSHAASRKGPAEVVRLAESFDQLLRRLQDAQARLAKSARLATLGQLSASVAHELRNPLSGIKMNARILADELARTSTKDPSLELIIREIDRMDLYLQELLSLASGEAAAPRRLEKKPTDLAQVAQSVVALLEGRCRHAGIAIGVDFAPGLPAVSADASQIRQVMMNLMLNAMDAMPSGGGLKLSTSPTADGGVRFSVSDTGGGVQAPDGADIFEPLVTTKSGGAGLGLHICRQIVAAHGGRIDYTTSPAGSTFFFDLPRK